MIAMTLAEVAAATGATLIGAPDVVVTSVEFDSRKVRPGTLFVALTGEHADGHLYAGAAAAAGAVAVLGSRPVEGLPTLVAAEIGAHAVTGNPAVDESGAVLAALSRLAQHVAARLTARGLTVIGVTGSAGKTSTKDLIAAVLAHAGTVVAPPESFNNELGFPYTVLRADESTDFLVLELSARGVGHIAALTGIARPRIGAVLNVGSAHLGEFGSREAIARAKGELVEALPSAAEGGVAILNADDEHVAAMAARTAASVVFTSTRDRSAPVRAENVALDAAARASFTLVTPEGTANVTLAVVGAHQVPNALAAAAVGRAAGMDVAVIAQALAGAGPASKWRMAVTEVSGVTVINDAYNANPESMRAALAALTHTAASGTRWAVLGEMAELGDAAPAAHRALAAEVEAAGVRLVSVGAGALYGDVNALGGASCGDADALGGASCGDADAIAGASCGDADALAFPDIEAAVAGLLKQIAPGDAVLVKASRAVGLERFAEQLIQALPSVLAGRTPAGEHSEERA